MLVQELTLVTQRPKDLLGIDVFHGSIIAVSIARY
jgi:hypothetical protein